MIGGRLAGLAVGAAAASGVAALAFSPGGPTGEAGSAAPPPVIRTAQVLSGNVDEGSFARFHADAESATGGSLTYSWDFGDGSEPRRGVDLRAIEHRYVDEGPGRHVVRLTVEDTDGSEAAREMNVTVSNVAPTIERMERTGAALVDGPLTFSAGVADPGLTDDLTLAWDFGDGGTARGSSVEHAYRAEGTYTVVLRVDDGDGGTDERSLSVTIGDGGAFSVGGGVQVPEMDVTFTSVAGALVANGMCQVRLDLAIEGEANVGLSAVLPQGLAEGGYTIGRPRQGLEAWGAEFAAPGVFMASLGVDSKHDPPERSLFGFASIGGTLDIEYFDGERIEGSFNILLRERTVPSANPRSASVSGHFARAVSRRIIGEGAIPGAFYLCDVGAEPMRIDAWSPAPNAWNVDWEEPEIAIHLTRPVDPASLAGNLRVEFRREDGVETGPVRNPDFREIPGDWMVDPGDAHWIRFVPRAPLMDAVIHCVRLRTGTDGIRGAGGEFLSGRLVQYDQRTTAACARFDLWAGQLVSTGFATTPVLENVRAAVYQVHRNMPLVPGKSTMTRIFWEWHPPPAELEIHRAAQVDWMPADAWVDTGEGGYGTKVRQPVRRSDRYQFEDSVFARNSLNFYGWRPSEGSAVTVRATVEPSDQTRETPRRYEGEAPGPIERQAYSPVFTFDYYFVRVGSWRDGVPDEARVTGHRLVEEGAHVTTQNFPFVATRPRYRGDLEVHDARWAWRCRRALTTGASTEGCTVQKVAQDLADARVGTDADVVVGLGPPDFAIPGQEITATHWFTGASPDQDLEGERAVLLVVGKAAEASLAHETGHLHGLLHIPSGQPITDPDRVCITPGHDHEGFRILPGGMEGRNKDEGNEEAPDLRRLCALMHEFAGSASDDRRLFVSRQNYVRLLEIVEDMERRRLGASGAGSGSEPEAQAASLWFTAAAAARPQVASEPIIRVAGVVNRILYEGTFQVVDADTGAIGDPRASGHADEAVRLRVLDHAGVELASTSVPVEPLGSLHEPAGPASEARFFTTAMRTSRNARAIVLERAGREIARRERSATPPEVSVSRPTASSVLGGRTSIAWIGDDADGDTLTYTLAYAPDGSTWRTLASGLEGTSAVVDADGLEDGPEPTLRVGASDGFDVVHALVPVRLPEALRVRATSPAAGELLPSGDAVIVAFQGQPAFPSLGAGAFELLDEDGAAVPASLVAEDGGRRLVLVPDAPLEPGAEYEAVLAAGLASADGRRLEREERWRFRVGNSAAAVDRTGIGLVLHEGDGEPLLRAGWQGVSRVEGEGLGLAARDFSMDVLLAALRGCEVPGGGGFEHSGDGWATLAGALRLTMVPDRNLELRVENGAASLVITASGAGAVRAAPARGGAVRLDADRARIELRGADGSWRCEVTGLVAFTFRDIG